MSPDVRVSRCVLDGSVVSLFRVGLEFEMPTGSLVLCGQAEVDKVDLVFFALAVAQEQVLGFDVVVNVALKRNRHALAIARFHKEAIRKCHPLVPPHRVTFM